MKLTLVDRIVMKMEDLLRFIYRFLWKLFHIKYYKNPEQHIPKDMVYCYEYTGKTVIKNHMLSDGKRIDVLPYEMPETKQCVFHKFLFHMDLCMLDGGDCMMDSCKTCGINEDWGDE